jgi:ATP-dependent RNA circularization protein (DNA/RNA ligase family)
MYLDFYNIFEKINRVQDWSVQSLGETLQITQNNFFEITPKIFTILPFNLENQNDYLLAGTLFFVAERIAIRGTPKIFYPFISTQHNLFASQAEQELRTCLEHESVIFEEKIDGINLRFFYVGEQYFFLPRFGAGLKKNPTDFNFEHTAQKILEKNYPRALELANSGHILIFELVSPAFDFLSLPSKKADLILIDVLKENKFLSRQEREKIAAATGFSLPRVLKILDQPLNDRQFLKEIKSLEYMAHQLGIEGMVAKGQNNEGEPVFLKIKAQGYRVEHIGTSEIPRRIINEVIQSLKIELGWESFVNQELSWPILLNELGADFVLTSENRQKIEQYYESERKLIAQKLEACQQAQAILQTHKFTSRKEVAQAAGNNSMLRQFLFQIWEESSHQ